SHSAAQNGVRARLLDQFYPQGERDQRVFARTSRVASSFGSLQFFLFRLKRPAPLVPLSGGFAHGFPAFFGDPMKVLAAVLDAPKGRQEAATLARRAFLGPSAAFAGFRRQIDRSLPIRRKLQVPQRPG